MLFLESIFQSINASFLAVAEIATDLPFLKATRLKKLDKWVSLRLPIALAACLKAILSLLLPFGVLLLRILPPDISLLVASPY